MTVYEIAREYEVHPVLAGKWKKELLDRLPKAFGHKPDVDAAKANRQRERLDRRAAELTMDIDFLKNKVRANGNPVGRATMIEQYHSYLSIRRQCVLLGEDRSRLYGGQAAPKADGL